MLFQYKNIYASSYKYLKEKEKHKPITLKKKKKAQTDDWKKKKKPIATIATVSIE